MKNFYNTLGVSEDASSNEIKKAFKEIAKKEHPDRGGNEKVFKEANEAYDTLKDTRKRQEYDTIRKYGQNMGGQGGNFHFTTRLYKNSPPSFRIVLNKGGYSYKGGYS